MDASQSPGVSQGESPFERSGCCSRFFRSFSRPDSWSRRGSPKRGLQLPQEPVKVHQQESIIYSIYIYIYFIPVEKLNSFLQLAPDKGKHRDPCSSQSLHVPFSWWRAHPERSGKITIQIPGFAQQGDVQEPPCTYNMDPEMSWLMFTDLTAINPSCPSSRPTHVVNYLCTHNINNNLLMTLR